jgi:GNAT superfamily N-acetyltransferase
VATFLPRVRDGRPWADRVRVLGPNAAGPIFNRLPGWVVSCQADLATQLVARGAEILRRAIRMCRNLAADPPPAAWSELRPAPALRLTSCERQASDLLLAWQAAYPVTHPDHFVGDGDMALRVRLVPQLAGDLYGPLSPLSTLATDTAGHVVAAVIVNNMDNEPPWNGPWITDLFRHPNPAYTGLGALLLRRVLAHAANAGLSTISLVVTEGNPAQRVYSRHGFHVAETTITVLIPDCPL